MISLSCNLDSVSCVFIFLSLSKLSILDALDNLVLQTEKQKKNSPTSAGKQFNALLTTQQERFCFVGSGVMVALMCECEEGSDEDHLTLQQGFGTFKAHTQI